MLTPKEVQGIVDQVNRSFEDVRERLSQLEAEVEALKKTTTKRGQSSKKTAEDANAEAEATEKA